MMVYSMESPEVPRKDYQSFGALVVRGASEELAAAAVRAAAKATMPADAEVTVTSFRRLEDESLSSELMLVSLSGAFAVMALLLTGLGLYGVLMRAVTLRRREIGIRIALGAGPGKIAASLGRRTLMEVAMGAAAGVGLAMLAEKAVRRLLQMAHVGGAAELAASVAVVAAVAALATAVPVLRAARVDPMQELRAE
jgi:ABC-type antimicrobial peptide transport system permease subunit